MYVVRLVLPADRLDSVEDGGLDNREIEEASIRQIVARLWRDAVDPAGTLVEKYLHGRGLFLPADMAGRLISKGTFALQGHDPKSRVQYKNIMVRPIK